MLSTTDKSVNGVIYEQVSVNSDNDQYSCNSCVGDQRDRRLCENLCDAQCSHYYVFKIKDITKQPTINEQQGVKTDTGKPRYGLIPPFALQQVAICLTEGLKTHPTKDNWKLVKDGKERFLESLERHFQQYKMGEVFDRDEPNVRNLAAVIVNALFALEFEVNPELNKEIK